MTTHAPEQIAGALRLDQAPMERAPRCADPCPLCGGPMANWMLVPADWRRPAAPEAYALYWCDGCAYGQVLPRPDRASIAGFYEVESYYTHARQSVRPSRRTHTLRDRIRGRFAWQFDGGAPIDEAWMRRWLAPGMRVCDLGCGKGSMLQQMKSHGVQGTGVEPDPVARKLAREQGLDVLRGTAEELPDELQGQRFDRVIMSHVLEHCLEPMRAVMNAAALLADGGMLIIETPNNEARGLKAAGVAWPWLDVPRHLNFFTARSLHRICQEAGLAVRHTEYRGYMRQFDPHWLTTEAEIRQILKRPPAPNSWKLLLKTALAPARAKYDSVRVFASAG